MRTIEAAGLTWQPLISAPDGAVEGTAKFDLSLALEQTPDGFAGVLEYSLDRFEPDTARRMRDNLRTLLAAVAAEPGLQIGLLPFISPGEQRQVLLDWNATATEVPLGVCFHELFQQQVARTPEAVAAVDENQKVTYRELNGNANRLARHLREKGVGPDVVVGLLMHRGVDLLTAILAVFKAGGAYLPLDPHHPAHRHHQVLNQAQVSQIIIERGLEHRLEMGSPDAPRLGLFFIDDLTKLNESSDDLENLITPSHLAYVIFTSGSTGMPKGAMVEHRGMLNHLYAKLNALSLGPRDVIAQTASQCFDISVWQFLSALLVGGQVHIIAEVVAAHPYRLFEQVASEGITILEVVPSLLRAALEEMNTRGAASPHLSALRWLLLTGEALPPELARRWLERQPGIPVLNAYGPTECSDDVAHHPIRDPRLLDVVCTPIGRPILNTRLYVLDRSLQPVPIGVPSELYVGGICVGRGYLNDAIRTSQAFVPDPYANGSPSRLYRTGDLARLLPNGDIEFLGRIDHQVKVRGFRIELGEIEAVLQQHPNVLQSVVVVAEDASANKRLVAYLVVADDTPISDIRERLSKRLPDYMIPSAFVILDEMPLTPNGKIDRRALPQPSFDRQGEPFVAPRTPTQEIIAGIWAEVLEVGTISIEDNFFELGGHSLLATQVVARISKLLSVDLPLRALFESPTVAGLAREVERAAGREVLPEIERISREGELPLSFAQQRLWFLDQ
ncbi:MAG TPA: amino acid adenylation domain-containing protein, partial [Blastocatellia bacterium]